jgi:hypothetical protein
MYPPVGSILAPSALMLKVIHRPESPEILRDADAESQVQPEFWESDVHFKKL